MFTQEFRGQNCEALREAAIVHQCGARCREGVRVVGDENVFSVAHGQALSAERGGNHRTPVAECFQDFNARAASRAQWGDERIRGFIPRPHVRYRTYHAHPGIVRDLAQSRGRISADHVHHKRPGGFAAEDGKNSLAEVDDGVFVGIDAQRSDEEEAEDFGFGVTVDHPGRPRDIR